MNERRLFLGCFISLVATAFAFAVRGAMIGDWRAEFNLSDSQVGTLLGVGLFPFAISIILFSLIIDKIGYGVSMVFAFVAHISSAIITIFAKDFTMLYIGTFIFSIGNGIVEAVINPAVATMYPKKKTHWLNVLHAGWPGGLVFGGLLAIAVMMGGESLGGALPGKIWQWQVGLVLLPTILYGILLLGQKFPEQERVAAGVSYFDMLREFGWGSVYVCSFFLIAGINQIMSVASIPPIDPLYQALLALIPTALFGLYVKSFGRPMFVFLLVIMVMLATTELGTDSWISDIMKSVLNDPSLGIMFLVYTSFIMFVLRFFAGTIVHRISPLGLLAASAAIACLGLLWLASAGSSIGLLFLAATFYAFGKSFLWPTTLGVVSEQYPRGGSLMLNAIAGIGMISVGTLGSPLIGNLQDRALDEKLAAAHVDLHNQIMVERSTQFGNVVSLDQAKFEALSDENKALVTPIAIQAKQGTLAKVAILPAIMLICYIGMILYFRTKGGYKAEELIGSAAEDEKFTGGTTAPGSA